jgi:putative ABC transport system permease protein
MFLAEVRMYPGRVLGVALACAVTAGVIGAGGALLVASEQAPESAYTGSSVRPEDVDSLFGLLASLTVMSAVTVIGTTVSLWTSQRLGGFAVLRALGASAAQLRTLVITDVIRLALISAVVGTAALTLPLAWAGRRLLIDRELFPKTIQIPSTPTMFATAGTVVAAIVLVAVLAGFGSVRSAGRVSPTAALNEQGMEPSAPRTTGRLTAGILLFVFLCLPLIVISAVPAVPALIRVGTATALATMLVPTLAVLAPWLIPTISRPFAAVLKVADPRLGKVAAAAVRHAPARTGAVAVPVLLAVGIAAALLGAEAGISTAMKDQTRSALRASAVVTPAAGNTTLPAPPPELPSGTVATAVVTTHLTPPPSGWDKHPDPEKTWGVDPVALPRVLDLDVQSGAVADLGAGSFAAGKNLADSRNWQVGKPISLLAADGSPVSLRLVAVYSRDLSFPQLLVPQSAVPAADAAAGPDMVLLTGDPRGWPARAGDVVRDRAGYLAHYDPRGGDALANYLIVAVVVGYALLSAANSSALAQRGQTTERAHLRALGLGRLQLARLVAAETLTAAAVGAVLAGVVALLCLAPLSLSLGLGFLPPLNVPWAVGVAAACVLFTAGPAVLAARPTLSVRRHFARRTS